MPDYTMPTGESGTMLIRDNGTTVEFLLSAPATLSTSETPWAATLNGVTEWRTFDLEAVEGYRLIHVMTVTYSQTVGFHLDSTNTTELGGPTDFQVYIPRGVSGNRAYVRVGNDIKQAIPYINVNGVWKEAEPWSRIAGTWKQTN